MAKAENPTPPLHYWDANVFTAFIENEAGRADVVAELLTACRDGRLTIFTSHVTLTEVAFAAIEKKDSKLSDEEESRINALWEHPSKIQLVEVSELVARQARALIRDGLEEKPHQWILKPIDAFQLASAMRIVVDDRRISHFSTYDDKLEKYDETCGFPIGPPKPLPKPVQFTLEGEINEG